MKDEKKGRGRQKGLIVVISNPLFAKWSFFFDFSIFLFSFRYKGLIAGGWGGL